MRPGRLVSLKLKMRAVPGQDCECEDSDKPTHLQVPQLLRGDSLPGTAPGPGFYDLHWATRNFSSGKLFSPGPSDPAPTSLEGFGSSWAQVSGEG